MIDTVHGLLRAQAKAVDEALADILRARGVDPDDRTEGWEDRCRAALADLELTETTRWTGDWTLLTETTIAPRRPPARRMGYGYGPWTAETLQPCRCGHLRGDHFRHSSSCLHSTDSETWACDCGGFEAR